jgi:hypothetical protein
MPHTYHSRFDQPESSRKVYKEFIRVGVLSLITLANEN